MAFTDRIDEAAYTGADGVRRTFQFTDVSRSVNRRVTPFKFPDTDGAFMQDNGNDPLVMPMQIYISGSDYDLDVDAFFESLITRGAFGILEHPRYGRRVVLPAGEIKQTDALVSGARQGVIEVTFFETIEEIFPGSQEEPASQAVESLSLLSDSQSVDFESVTENADVLSKSLIQERIESSLGSIQGRLQPLSDSITNAGDSVRQQTSEFTDIFDSISLGIDTFIETPFALGKQIELMISSVSQTESDVVLLADKISSYGDLINDLIGEDAAAQVQNAPNGNTSGDNSTVLIARSTVMACVRAAINGGVETRQDAIRQAQEIGRLHDMVVDWSENAGVEGDGVAARQLLLSVSLAQAFLVTQGALLPVELNYVTQRPRNMIELLRQLYQRDEVDELLNQFINDNSIHGDALILIPPLTNIVYRRLL